METNYPRQNDMTVQGAQSFPHHGNTNVNVQQPTPMPPASYPFDTSKTVNAQPPGAQRALG